MKARSINGDSGLPVIATTVYTTFVPFFLQKAISNQRLIGIVSNSCVARNLKHANHLTHLETNTVLGWARLDIKDHAASSFLCSFYTLYYNILWLLLSAETIPFASLGTRIASRSTLLALAGQALESELKCKVQTCTLDSAITMVL
jgi:hypothetical protein